MPTAQDHAFALLVAQRGAVSPDALARARELVERSGGGQTLAQVLLEQRLLGPAAVAEGLRELARSSYVCASCHQARAYDALARLSALACPACGGALAIVPAAPPDPRLAHTLGATVAGAPAPAARARPRPLPSGAHVVPSGLFPTLGSAPPPPASAPGGAHASHGGALVSPAAPAAPAAHGVGRTIGPYEVLKELGRGSNGVVYLARRPGLERRFAVKVLRERTDPEAVHRFRQEAALASKIDDPGVIAVFDVGRHAGHDYYAMEYCPGVTLAERLARGALPPGEAASLVERLATTVEAAHQRQVIHRDLKPANVILEEGSGRPRILDFGLARDRTQERRLTRSGDVLGTPYYMAPEQIRGDRDIDHRIDVYALGVILFECLTARRPFEATTVVELAEKIQREQPPRPRALRPDVPEALEAICLRAMAKDPAARHGSARELAEALARFRATSDRPPPVRRARFLIGLAAVAGSATLALAVLGRRPDAATPVPSQGPATTEGVATVEAAAGSALQRHLARARTLARERASDAVVLEELDAAEQAAGADARQRVTVRLERAALLARRGKYAQAAALAAALVDDAALAGDAALAHERAEALRILAFARERQGDEAAARDAWTRLAEADQGAPGLVARATLARLALDVPEHRARASEATRAHPGYPPALLERALAELAAGDTASAATTAREASAAWPDDVMAHVVVALSASAREDRAAALDEAVRLSEPDPDRAALILRAKLSVGDGRLQAALGDVERLLARDRDDVPALVLRGAALHGLAASGDADARRAAATDAWRGAHAADPEAFLQVVEALPEELRGAAREAAGVAPDVRPGERPPVPLAAEARARLERWAQAAPEPARRPLRLALLAAGEGQPLARFEAWLREAVAAAPDSARVAYLEARLLEGRDAYEQALAAIDRARGLDAPGPALDLLQGEVLWFQGKGNDAVKVWDALARRSPTDPHGLCAAAWARFARDDLQGAIATAAEALRRAPDLASASVIQGMSYGATGRYRDAEACYERVLAHEGALIGRVPLFELDAELGPLIQAQAWKGQSTPEIDERFERMEALFGLGGATTRLIPVDKVMTLGATTRWFERCQAWIADGQRLEPWRAELDMWLGFVVLYDPKARADDVLAHWLRAQEKDPRVVLSPGMRERFKWRFGARPELERFPAR